MTTTNIILAGGERFDATKVRVISAKPAHTRFGLAVAPAVTMMLAGGGARRIECPTDAAAEVLRDRLKAQVADAQGLAVDRD